MRLSGPLALLAVMTLASPAAAQNAGQISQVRAGANCPKCNLFQAELGGLTLKGKNLAGARLRQADLSLTIMNRTNFAGADLTNASFVGTHLEGANFRGARLRGANFSGAEMDRVTGLTQAQLNQACGDVATRLPGGLRIPPC